MSVTAVVTRSSIFFCVSVVSATFTSGEPLCLAACPGEALASWPLRPRVSTATSSSACCRRARSFASAVPTVSFSVERADGSTCVPWSFSIFC